MEWRGRRASDNVNDRRRLSGGGKVALGGGVIGILFLVVQYFMGADPMQLVQQAIQQTTASQQEEVFISSEEDEMAQFISVALADNEDVWHQVFEEYNIGEYREPKLVLFRNAVESGCGNASAAMGPFYCPADEKIYIDLTFFDELKSRFGAQGGDFAIAYVLAHEVGHHVQNLLGTSGKVRQLQQQTDETNGNKLSVALELQADFYAGVWASRNNKMKNVIEEGDIEEALSAASAVGDDKLQKKSQGYVVPDAFTHGSSEQRMYWFKLGFQTGDIRQGDTFKQIQ